MLQIGHGRFSGMNRCVLRLDRCIFYKTARRQNKKNIDVCKAHGLRTSMPCFEQQEKGHTTVGAAGNTKAASDARNWAWAWRTRACNVAGSSRSKTWPLVTWSLKSARRSNTVPLTCVPTLTLSPVVKCRSPKPLGLWALGQLWRCEIWGLQLLGCA